ncbi:MAG TPA: hypothetical protein VF088_17355 [Pyrinomonadaceae bacterium]
MYQPTVTASHHSQGKKRKKPKQPKKPKNSPAPAKSACETFAEELASRLFDAVVREGGYNPDSRHDLANEMDAQAQRDVDLKGVPYQKGVYPIDGFKNELTRFGQDADVYHHILFTAGNTLHGTAGGDSASAGLLTTDWRGAYVQKRQESLTEIQDDYAGMNVGNMMLSTALAGKSGDYSGLKKQIMQRLCAFRKRGGSVW